ncbi:MAG TPA: zinc ribbon domain-containing protein [Terriglobales bacterium]|nr:zinc ribbon domain-containing protein [Terriglobales bacterium]HUL14939.1 zinc ribbon domain-containing protein [Terriglobales bacterium]
MANIAGFCTKCGSPHESGQAFCMKCGASVGAGSAPSQPAQQAPAAPQAPAARPATPAATPPAAAAPVSSAPAMAAPAAKKGGGALIKVLLALAVVFVLFVGAAIAGIWYVGHRVKQKMASLGLNQPETSEPQTSSTVGMNLCSWLSNAEVSQAVKADIVRAEAPQGGDPGCTYSAQGDPGDFTAKHATLLMGKNADKNAQAQMENMGKSFFRNEEQQGGANPSEHPGETPVFQFSMDTSGNATATIRLTEKMMGALGPAGGQMVPGVGDEAFQAGGVILMVRKGNKLAKIMYMMCPCTTEDVLPLAKKIADSM